MKQRHSRFVSVIHLLNKDAKSQVLQASLQKEKLVVSFFYVTCVLYSLSNFVVVESEISTPLLKTPSGQDPQPVPSTPHPHNLSS